MRLCCLKGNQLRKLMLNLVLLIQDGVVMLVTSHGTTKTCKHVNVIQNQEVTPVTGTSFFM